MKNENWILNCDNILTLLIIGESTVSDVPLQLGDPAFDYNVTVQVHIFDRIGDKSTFSTEIRVIFCAEISDQFSYTRAS